MFVGHYAPAVYDTQRGAGAPLIPLWHAFLAVQAIDIVHAFVMMTGNEGQVLIEGAPLLYIPWSHSLLSAVLISLTVGLLYRLVRPLAGYKGGFVMALFAFSHWPLDWLVHRPDLLLWPYGERMLGLGLWDFAWPSYALEVGLLGLAVAWWLSVTRGPRWTTVASWAVVAGLAVLQFVAITGPTLLAQAGEFGADDLAPGGVAGGLLLLAVFGGIALAIALIERARVPKPTSEPTAEPTAEPTGSPG